MRRAAVAPGDEESASNGAPAPGKMRSPQVVLTASPPQELNRAPLGVIGTAPDANHELADDAGMRTSQSLREAGTQVRNLNRINGKQAARRAPQRPDAYLHAESWAEAHNLLFQGDMDDRPDGVPPGLISTDQLADIQMIWKKLDTDGSGTLSLQELDRALKLLGYDGSDEDMAELIGLIDEDGSGGIEWEEFRTLLVTKVVEESNQVEVELTFAMLDINGDGNIDANEAKAFLMHAGEQLSEAEADDLVHLLSSGSGKITRDSYIHGMDQVFKARPSTSLAQAHTSKGAREARKTLHARRGTFSAFACSSSGEWRGVGGAHAAGGSRACNRLSEGGSSRASGRLARANPFSRSTSSPSKIREGRALSQPGGNSFFKKTHSSPAPDSRLSASLEQHGASPGQPRRNSLELPRGSYSEPAGSVPNGSSAPSSPEGTHLVHPQLGSPLAGGDRAPAPASRQGSGSGAGSAGDAGESRANAAELSSGG